MRRRLRSMRRAMCGVRGAERRRPPRPRNLPSHLPRPPTPPHPRAAQPLEYETAPSNGLTRVKYTREGWKWWEWRGRRVHYIEAGAANTGTPVLLVGGGVGWERWGGRAGACVGMVAAAVRQAVMVVVGGFGDGAAAAATDGLKTPATNRPTNAKIHGYGASAVHWRYQIPALEAAGHRVYARERDQLRLHTGLAARKSMRPSCMRPSPQPKPHPS
jgi:hypothetical protein